MRRVEELERWTQGEFPDKSVSLMYPDAQTDVVARKIEAAKVEIENLQRKLGVVTL